MIKIKKNKKFKIGLMFCCLLVCVCSILNFVPFNINKINVSADSFDVIQDDFVITENDSTDYFINYISSHDFYGYFELAGIESSSTGGGYLHFYLYDLNSNAINYSLLTNAPTLYWDNGTTLLNNNGFGVSTIDNATSYRVYLAYSAVAHRYLLCNTDLCVLYFNFNGSTNYFCSKYFYNQYLTAENYYNKGLADGSSSGQEEVYNQGYLDGKNDGLTEGYNNGFDVGKLAGIEEGTQTGYNTGYNNGYNKGSSDGYDTGYSVGNEAGYKDGYDFGYEDGEYNGYMNGLSEGYNDGEEVGFENGYNEGYSKGSSDGYMNGYNEGESAGIDSGYGSGYSVGYEEGLEHGSDYNFNNLLSAIIDVPVKYFQSLFNFELLGINLQGFLTGLFTLCILVTIVKLCLGGR